MANIEARIPLPVYEFAGNGGGDPKVTAAAQDLNGNGPLIELLRQFVASQPGVTSVVVKRFDPAETVI